MKKVYKYGTGQEIPEGATYLCTLAETETIITGAYSTRDGIYNHRTDNRLVWHYFLVEELGETTDER